MIVHDVIKLVKQTLVTNQTLVEVVISVRDFNTCVNARRILDAAKIAFHPYANRVVSIGKHQTLGGIVVETGYFTSHASVVLQTSVRS